LGYTITIKGFVLELLAKAEAYFEAVLAQRLLQRFCGSAPIQGIDSLFCAS
jgi:hypothetical protein